MINSKYFFQGFSCIRRLDSPAFALFCCMIAIGALFKNIGFHRISKRSCCVPVNVQAQ